MKVDFSKLHPELVARYERVRAACEALGLTIVAVQGFRSFAEQDALYAQGRTVPGKRVTNARAGYSLHNFGRAIDFAFKDADGSISWEDSNPWQLVGRMGEVVGLEWGGRWSSFPDRPHLQWLGAGETLESLRANTGTSASS